MTEPILEFQGEYRFLSNFYTADFVWDNIWWPNSEAAYQAAKTLDRKHRLLFAQMKNPVTSKREGKLVKLRADWESVKVGLMTEIVYEKFNQNAHLKAKLLATGDAHLEEGNHHRDTIWGVCPPGSGNGKNLLGLILMKVRDELQGT